MKNLSLTMLSLRPKQPLVDWLNALGDSHEPLDLGLVRQEPTAILLPEFDSTTEAMHYVHRRAREIFESELAGWSSDRDTWPSKTDFRTFQKWFDLEFCSMVYDGRKAELSA